MNVVVLSLVRPLLVLHRLGVKKRTLGEHLFITVVQLLLTRPVARLFRLVVMKNPVCRSLWLAVSSLAMHL